MDYEGIKDYIVNWLCVQLKKTGLDGFVVGVSGGIDSAVVSRLSAITHKSVIVVSMPINQEILPRAKEHIKQLKKDHSNVMSYVNDLSVVFNTFNTGYEYTELALVNLRSRLRMVALYAISNSHNYLVLGTGNKNEDIGIGFYTKYGDGGVDISPIGDLYKSEVCELAKSLKINKDIIDATPSDGLWEDGRSDEDQIGATYSELEWAMKFCSKLYIRTLSELNDLICYLNLDKRQMEVLKIYLSMHEKNGHKMKMPLICYVS